MYKLLLNTENKDLAPIMMVGNSFFIDPEGETRVEVIKFFPQQPLKFTSFKYSDLSNLVEQGEYILSAVFNNCNECLKLGIELINEFRQERQES